MMLVMYNEKQNALRLYCTDYRAWFEPLNIRSTKFGYRYDVTSLTAFIELGWELIGEL